MRTLAALFLGLVFATPAAAQAPPLTPQQADEVRRLVRDTLLRNPEILLEALDALEEKKRADTAAQQTDAVARLADALERDPADPESGAAAGDVTLVEFSDYRCPYCKQMAEPLAALLRADDGLRLVHKELPILGPESVVAAKAALAAQRQGGYAPMHSGLMARRGALDEAAVLETARDAGLDVERLRADMADPAIAARIERNLALARELAITGTPAFVLGGRLIPGAVDAETMKRLVAETRAKR